MKTYVFDASALFAFLQQKPGASKVSELLKDAMRGRAAIFMSAVNYGEVYGAVIRGHGPERARATMSAVQPLPISFVDATPLRAFHAVEVNSEIQSSTISTASLQRWPWNTKERW